MSDAERLLLSAGAMCAAFTLAMVAGIGTFRDGCRAGSLDRGAARSEALSP
jgi:hypothetical protein